jgi:hypothetical protein
MAGNRIIRCVRPWNAGAGMTAAAAVMIGMGTAHADTPDDVINHAITELNQGNVLLDAASTADLSVRQADALAEQTSLSTQANPLLLQLESLQDNLPAGDQNFLGSVDEQLVTAAQNVVSADQAFVAADQAGDLSSNSFLPIDLTTFEADLGLGGAALNADFKSIFALFDPDIGTLSAASASSAADTTPADLLSQASTNFTDANQVLTQIPAVGDASTVGLVEQQNVDLQDIAQLGTSESALSSYDNGAVMQLLDPLFNSVNQRWDQASEAVLNADQALQIAAATGSGTTIDTPIYDLLGAQLQSPIFSSDFIDLTAHFLTGIDPFSAGVDTASAIDPGIVADLLSSIGF